MSLSHPNLTCVTSRQQLAVQRTAIHGRSGLQNLDGCTRLKYVDVTGLKNLKGLIPNRLLRKPGLRLSLAGSGLEKEDLPHGNQDRYALSSADMLLFMTFLADIVFTPPPVVVFFVFAISGLEKQMRIHRIRRLDEQTCLLLRLHLNFRSQVGSGRQCTIAVPTVVIVQTTLISMEVSPTPSSQMQDPCALRTDGLTTAVEVSSWLY